MTQHSTAGKRARAWKLEAESLRGALELESQRHTETCRVLSQCQRDLSDERTLRSGLVLMLRRHGIEV